MQLIWLNATATRYDEDAFLVWKNKKLWVIKNEQNNPRYNFQKAQNKLVLKNPKRLTKNYLSTEQIEMVDYKEAFDFYNSRFNSANGFHYTFSGNITPEQLHSYIEVYIANIPSKKTKINIINRNEGYNQKSIREEIFLGNENLSMTCISYTNNYLGNDNQIDRIKFEIMFDLVLGEMLRESVREKMSEVYTINTRSDGMNYPVLGMSNDIIFASDPANVDNILIEVDNQVNLLKNGKFEEKYFISAIETKLQQIEKVTTTNQYWVKRINDYQIKNQKTFYNEAKIVSELNKEELSILAKKYLDDNKKLTLILFPQK